MTQSRKTLPLALELADLEIDVIAPQRQSWDGLEGFVNSGGDTEMVASSGPVSCCSCCVACCCCCW